MEMANYLSRVGIFSQLSSQDVATLTDKLRRRTFSRSEVIFHQDEPGEQLHLVAEGLVKISIVSPDGRESDIALIQPGDCFGEMSVLDGGMRSATAVAVEPTQTMSLSRDDFLAFLDEHPKVSGQIITLLVKRLRATDTMVGDMVFLDVPTRVAKKLLELVHTQPDHRDDSGNPSVLMGHEELSGLVGTRRETVSRGLINYRKQGVVTTTHRRITINDMEALERLAGS